VALVNVSSFLALQHALVGDVHWQLKVMQSLLHDPLHFLSYHRPINYDDDYYYYYYCYYYYYYYYYCYYYYYYYYYYDYCTSTR